MHEVRLAEADAAIKKQRVEADGAAFGDATGSRMGQFVGFAHDEGVEGEARVERCARHLIMVGATGGLLGPLRRSHGAGGGCLGRGGAVCHRKFHPVDLCTGGVHLGADVIREIARDPIAEKGGGHLKARDPLFEIEEFQRFDPGHIVVSANPLDQFLADQTPSLVRHSS